MNAVTAEQFIAAEGTKIKTGCPEAAAGVLPNDWHSIELKELGEWKGGATPSMNG